jgi:hypothetical protein
VVCSSGISFDPVADGVHYTFDVSGLYNGLFIMSDRQTGSLWTHYDGAVLEGPLGDAGVKLELKPLIHTTWGQWQALHPDTLVPEWETPYTDRYRDIDPGGSGLGQQFQQSLLHTDDRLEENELVLGAGVGIDVTAYVLADFDGLTVVSDELGGYPIVAFLNPNQDFGIAYSAAVEGTVLTFTVDSGAIVDNEGTAWDITGFAIAGPREGQQLQFVTSFVTEWYGWVAYYPNTSIYGQ